MKLLKLFVFGLLSLLMLAMVAIYLSPLDAYVPEVEQALGNQLHEPVSVRYLRLAALPIPHLELQGVLLCGREGIAVKSMDIELDLAGLLTGRRWCAVSAMSVAGEFSANAMNLNALKDIFNLPAM